MSEQHITPTCDRCGAPTSKGRERGGRLVPLKGYRARHYLAKRGSSIRRVPPGYEHSDPAFCERRGTLFSRTPVPWGLRGRPEGV